MSFMTDNRDSSSSLSLLNKLRELQNLIYESMFFDRAREAVNWNI